MALLGNARRPPLSSLFGALLLVTVSGCVLMESLGLFTPERGFSHRIHADSGLSCDDCHAPETGEEPGMPTQDLCMLCHEDIDPEKPEELRASALFESGGLAGETSPHAFADEVLFSHAEHADAVLDCSTCHEGVEQSETIDGSLRLDMGDCTACHDDSSSESPDDCSVCHSELGTEVAPSTHAHQWTRLHGQTVRADSQATVDDCSLCHERDDCISCHKDQAPTNHNNIFRLRSHGVLAAIDRDNCAVCHTRDSCDRCHEETTPTSHRGSYGAPKATHCFGCHLPVQQNSCFTCHKGTPSHSLAAPKPDDHLPGLDCRQCHGLDAPLPHVDAGQNCNICHK